MKIFILFFLSYISVNLANQFEGLLPNGGKLWALLVAGSNQYYNYRHQADICHAYQILHKNGIPDEQIIVMMYDDIANNTENPRRGVIINQPNGTDVYRGVLKDYIGADVTPKNFLNVLMGDRKAMKKIGSGRVIESGVNDHIFVYFADHGAPGLLAFPSDELYADNLITTLKSMSKSRRFAKMLLYVEACESGSMFDNLLPDTLKIMAMTASDPHESSYACYYDEDLNTFLGDVFSVKWMEDCDKENLSKETIHHQYEIVRTETNTSHVEEYGALDIGSDKLSNFLGFKRHTRPLKNNEDNDDPSPLQDAISSRDVYIELLRRNRNKCKETESKKCHHHEFKYHKALKLRRHLELTIKNILTYAEPNSNTLDLIHNERYPLTKEIFPCYKDITKHFNKNCFPLRENSHALSQLYKFVNYCSLNGKIERILTAIDDICSNIIRSDNIH